MSWRRRGVRFDRAQATSSWTLPSHASMFTGRWPHELSAGWLTPLDADVSDRGRVSGEARLRDGRFHRQLLVLRVQLRARPRFYRLSRLHLPAADRVQAGRAGQSPAGRSSSRSSGSSKNGWTSILLLRPAVDGSSGSSSGIEKRRRMSIASYSTGCHAAGSRSGPFSPS